VCPPAREVRRQVLLLLSEDIHREATGRVDGLTRLRLLVDAKQHKVDPDRDDCHAGGELSDRLPEEARVNHLPSQQKRVSQESKVKGQSSRDSI
jgi:hypothetical protein